MTLKTISNISYIKLRNEHNNVKMFQTTTNNQLWIIITSLPKVFTQGFSFFNARPFNTNIKFRKMFETFKNIRYLQYRCIDTDHVSSIFCSFKFNNILFEQIKIHRNFKWILSKPYQRVLRQKKLDRIEFERKLENFKDGALYFIS